MQPVQYRYDGTFPGLLTAVFQWFLRKEKIVSIVRPTGQLDLFAQTVTIETSPSDAERVWNGIERVGGSITCNHIYHAFLSACDGVEMLILEYCQLLFAKKNPIYTDLGNIVVLQIHKLDRKVLRESHRVLMFVRFEQASDGTYFAPFDPKYDVLPLVINHFKERFMSQNWLIYDTRRDYGFHFNGLSVDRVTISNPTFSMQSGKLFESVSDSKDEQWQNLWATYFKSIAIKERENLLVQRNFMPKRFWKYLTEKSK